MLLWTLRCMYLLKLLFYLSLNIYPRMELLDHIVVLFWVFWWASMLFSKLAVPIVHKGSLFSASIPLFIICRLLDDSSHFKRCEVITHCGFNLHFSGEYQCWASFHIPVGHQSSLEKWLFSYSACFIISFFSNILSQYELFIYLGY